MSPFSAPFFWGTEKRGLLLPKREAALWEGTQWCKGGTGKAEAAKLQDAGISLNQCPERCVAEKGTAHLDSAKLGENRRAVGRRKDLIRSERSLLLCDRMVRADARFESKRACAQPRAAAPALEKTGAS
jgi:hypothetical protein